MTPVVKSWLGCPYPLGATWLGNGVNFALFSESATSVDLCLFDNIEARQEYNRVSMIERTDQVNPPPSQCTAWTTSGTFL